MCRGGPCFYTGLSERAPGKVLCEADAESLRNYYYFYFPTKQWGRTALQATCQVWRLRAHLVRELPQLGLGARARVTLKRPARSSARRTECEVRRASVSTAGSVLPLRGREASRAPPDSGTHVILGGGHAQGLPWPRPRGSRPAVRCPGSRESRGVCRAAHGDGLEAVWAPPAVPSAPLLSPLHSFASWALLFANRDSAGNPDVCMDVWVRRSHISAGRC